VDLFSRVVGVLEVIDAQYDPSVVNVDSVMNSAALALGLPTSTGDGDRGQHLAGTILQFRRWGSNGRASQAASNGSRVAPARMPMTRP